MSVTTFEGTVHVWTAKAVLFQSYYWEGPLWFPVSQSTILEDDDSHVIKVKDWLVNKREIREFVYYDADQIERINEL